MDFEEKVIIGTQLPNLKRDYSRIIVCAQNKLDEVQTLSSIKLDEVQTSMKLSLDVQMCKGLWCTPKGPVKTYDRL